jgi:hypothetical protein
MDSRKVLVENLYDSKQAEESMREIIAAEIAQKLPLYQRELLLDL